MNKAKLIERLSEENNLTKEKAGEVIDSLVEIIMTKVNVGQNVKIKGFGTFTKYKRRSRFGRNPITGKKIKILGSWWPKFIPSSAFKEKVK